MKKKSKSFTGVTHDNGNRSFVVHVDDIDRAFIYRQIVFLPREVSQVFRGEEDSAMLLKLKKNVGYYFVGTEVYSFTTEEKITDFASIIGRSDCPYPYAESENYFYILLDMVYIKKPEVMDKGFDVYEYYYENMDSIPVKKLRGLKKISKRV